MLRFSGKDDFLSLNIVVGDLSVPAVLVRRHPDDPAALVLFPVRLSTIYITKPVQKELNGQLVWLMGVTFLYDNGETDNILIVGETQEKCEEIKRELIDTINEASGMDNFTFDRASPDGDGRFADN